MCDIIYFLNMEEDIAKNKLEIIKIRIELLGKEHSKEYIGILEKRMKVLKKRNVETGRILRKGKVSHVDLVRN